MSTLTASATYFGQLVRWQSGPHAEAGRHAALVSVGGSTTRPNILAQLAGIVPTIPVAGDNLRKPPP